MFYIVYKITNIINNKIYIGVHKTKDINDDYMGSGTLLKRAQEKYGIENFTKEILEVFNNPEDMFNMESKLVNEEFVSRDDTYNISLGGKGSWEHINNNTLLKNKAVENRIEKIKYLKKYDKEWNIIRKNNASKAQLESYKNGRKSTVTGYEFLGKKHTEYTKKIISEKQKENTKGSGNSQYGTMWIHNISLKENKKIKKDEFTTYEQQGWIKGRKMKF